MNRKEFDLVVGSQAGQHLGDLVGWSMKDVKLPMFRVEALVEQYGLKEDLVLPKLSPTSAYRRAIRKVTTKGAHDERKYVAVRIVDNDKYVGHAIVRSDVVDSRNTEVSSTGELISKDASFNTAVKIGLDKEKKGAWKEDPVELLITTDGAHPVVQEIVKLYRDLVGVYTSDDIRTAFQTAFVNWSGMRMLSHGGLWLVLSEYSEKVRKWRDLMGELKCCEPLIVPVFDTEEGTDSFRKMAHSNLMDQLGQLKLDIQGFAKKTRVSTMEKRLEDFRTLRNKANLYKDVLGLEIDKISDGLAGAEKDLSSLLLERETENNA